MLGGIPGVEEEAYFSSHLDSSGQGTGVHRFGMVLVS